MEACYGGADVMERSCAVARGIDINTGPPTKAARCRMGDPGAPLNVKVPLTCDSPTKVAFWSPPVDLPKIINLGYYSGGEHRIGAVAVTCSRGWLPVVRADFAPCDCDTRPQDSRGEPRGPMSSSG
jgi:hypothetical protein